MPEIVGEVSAGPAAPAAAGDPVAAVPSVVPVTGRLIGIIEDSPGKRKEPSIGWISATWLSYGEELLSLLGSGLSLSAEADDGDRPSVAGDVFLQLRPSFARPGASVRAIWRFD